ncbi:MAG TPA: IS701 family transposase [Blastocatellia bacterium]|nr:IS701 family transposase [Blastocatellia bacterium]
MKSEERTKTAIEEAEAWAKGLLEIDDRISIHFPRSEPRHRALAYLKGLISPIERKNGWQLAEQAGDDTPYGVQHLSGRAEWDADKVRDDLSDYVNQYLGEQEAVLVVDETGFLKKDDHSVGVQRQYSGTAGRIENCQIGVLLAYTSSKGRTFIDRELYLPKQWAESAERREEAGVPKQIKFATKPQLAQKMIKRAIDSGIAFKWVTGDEIYGNDRTLRVWIEQQSLFYVMAIASNQHVWLGFKQVRINQIVKQITKDQWQVLSAGEGSKGPRLYEWALVPLLSIMIDNRRWLLVRRSISDPKEMAYYVVYGPPETKLEEMVKVAGRRWAIEESFETAKGEVGLDQYEVRSWQGWYRHITLAMLAHSYLTVMRAKAETGKKAGRKKRGRIKRRREK